MRRTSETGRRRGVEPSVFPISAVRRAAGRTRQEVPDYREHERHYIQEDFSAH